MQKENRQNQTPFITGFKWFCIFAMVTALGGTLLLPVLVQTSVPGTTAFAQDGRSGTGISGLGPGADTPAVVPVEPAPSTQAPLTGEVTGMVRDEQYNLKPNVPVRFWRSGREESPIQIETDQNGIYSLELGDGAWTGCACGSPDGYTPLFWKVSVLDGKVIHLLETSQIAPVIDSISIEISSDKGIIQPGDLVILRGSGFGCSGKAIIELPGHIQLEAADLKKHTDIQVAFPFPSVPKTSQPIVLVHVDVMYAHGRMKSNLISFQSTVHQALSENDLTPGGGQSLDLPGSQPGATQPLPTGSELERKKRE